MSDNFKNCLIVRHLPYSLILLQNECAGKGTNPLVKSSNLQEGSVRDEMAIGAMVISAKGTVAKEETTFVNL